MDMFRVVALVYCLCASALARPQQLTFDQFGNQIGRTQSRGNFGFDERNYVHIPILRDVRSGPIDGVYDFEYETGDGVYRQESGRPTGPFGSVVSQGGWSFTFPDGTPAQFNFVANENGYYPESSLIPTTPKPPPHAIEQIRRSERERAAGIFHDGQWDPHRYGGGQWDPVRYGGGHYTQSGFQKK